MISKMGEHMIVKGGKNMIIKRGKLKVGKNMISTMGGKYDF